MYKDACTAASHATLLQNEVHNRLRAYDKQVERYVKQQADERMLAAAALAYESTVKHNVVFTLKPKRYVDSVNIRMGQTFNLDFAWRF